MHGGEKPTQGLLYKFIFNLCVYKSHKTNFDFPSLETCCQSTSHYSVKQPILHLLLTLNNQQELQTIFCARTKIQYCAIFCLKKGGNLKHYLMLILLVALTWTCPCYPPAANAPSFLCFKLKPRPFTFFLMFELYFFSKGHASKDPNFFWCCLYTPKPVGILMRDLCDKQRRDTRRETQK